MNNTKTSSAQLRLINQFKQYVSDFNMRPLSFEDLQDACGQHGFKIFEEQLPARLGGMAFQYGGVTGMILDSRATEQERVFLGFHELAHLVFHLPAGLTHNSPHITRIEREANAMGKLALMPDSPSLTVKQIMKRYDVRQHIAETCANLVIA